MKRIRTLPLLILVTLTTALAYADTPKTDGHTQAQETKETFDFKFSGGSIKELADQLTELEINIMLPLDAFEIEIPAFNAKRITVDTLFKALNNLLEARLPERSTYFEYARPYTPNSNAIWTLYDKKEPFAQRTERTPEIVSIESKVASLEKQIKSLGKQTVRFQETIVEPLNISHLLSDFSIDDISTVAKEAVKAHSKAAQIEGPTGEVELKFHKETEVLILAGTRTSVRIALNTIRQISKLPSSANTTNNTN